uniref:Uncharacterized protein n=1 Tax=Octopus bimaculoides TaxID=37653 RepID=A0A0L8GD19_OCTBM
MVKFSNIKAIVLYMNIIEMNVMNHLVGEWLLVLKWVAYFSKKNQNLSYKVKQREDNINQSEINNT